MGNHIHHVASLNARGGSSALGIAVYGDHPQQALQHIRISGQQPSRPETRL
ncbi:MAG: hypothetical protein R2865_09250 [Deinococcales bacterium]